MTITAGVTIITRELTKEGGLAQLVGGQRVMAPAILSGEHEHIYESRLRFINYPRACRSTQLPEWYHRLINLVTSTLI